MLAGLALTECAMQRGDHPNTGESNQMTKSLPLCVVAMLLACAEGDSEVPEHLPSAVGDVLTHGRNGQLSTHI